jgi:hypothetical protein
MHRSHELPLNAVIPLNGDMVSLLVSSTHMGRGANGVDAVAKMGNMMIVCHPYIFTMQSLQG